jgi:predicted RNA-binding protein with PUA-like domain
MKYHFPRTDPSKADAALREMKLLKQTRLSVTPLAKAEFAHLLELAETKI